jgi:glycosyltransferase involved in cell wall biosynthesis
MGMSDSLRLAERETGSAGAALASSSGRSGVGRQSAGQPGTATRVSIASVADQVRFAFGQDAERRIAERAGFRFWQCNVDGGYVHTHPLLGETNAVLALSASTPIAAAVSVVVHTRNALAPDVEYAIILVPHANALVPSALNHIIDCAVQRGGRYAGPEGAAAVAVVPPDTEHRLHLDLPADGAISGSLVLAVRPVADVVDHAYATWSDLQVVRTTAALPAALPRWAAECPMLDSVFADVAGLFEAAWYLRSARQEGRAAVSDDLELFKEYLTAAHNPWMGPDAHPLFDAVHYARQVPRQERQLHPLVHYLTSGWKAGLSPHPLFDPTFYAGQTGGQDRPALVHYLQEGWKAGFTPHRLFSPEHFIRTANLAEPLAEAPLVSYLRGDHTGDPHYLFDTQHYLRFLGFPNWDGIAMRCAEFNRSSPLPEPSDLGAFNPLVHYIQLGSKSHKSPHLLFDPDWYAAQRQKIEGLPLPSSEWDPLTDYLDIGVRHRLSPSRLVDIEHYVSQTELPDGEDCVRHYLLGSEQNRVSPTPAMDAAFYTWHAPAALEMKSPLHHLLSTPAEERKKTLALFDPDYYLSAYPDIAGARVCPIVHFVCFGARENRRPNGVVSDVYAASHIIENPQDLATPHFGYLRATGTRRVRLLFTSHDASRSGAPAIILSLIRSFAEHANAECFTILDRGGELLPEFQRHSHTMVMSRSVLEVGSQADDHDRDIRHLMGLLGGNPPAVALVNSAECRHLGQRLARHGIPVISLVHETPSYYPPEEFDLIYRASRRVIFPSSYIDETARTHCPYPENLALVRGQGLLRPGFGQIDREQARRKVFQELGLGSDAALVIGCGAVDFRKGADLFLSAATALDRRLRDKPGHRPVFFCWLGGGPDLDNLRREVERSKTGHVVRFIGPKPDVERYFVAGDVFALTSRSDPFPCVVHEAMAAGMPVVGFEGGGGAVELFGAQAGIAVPFGDAVMMADAIEALAFDDDRRLRMGQAARRIIAERGSNEAYFEDIRSIASEVTGFDLERRLGERRIRKGRKVFFLASDWGVSGVNSLAESLVNGLNARGFSAEIVFTRGRFGYWGTDHKGRTSLPDAPYSRLEPAANSAAAIWQELQRFLAEQSPCVVIPNYDYLASAITPILNSNVGVIGVLHSDDVEHYEHGYRLGQYWNRIVAVSDHIERRMLELNPSFKDRLRVLHSGVAPLPDVDVEAKFPNKDEAFQLVYTGRFENYQKGIRRYVTLADRLAERGVKTRLVMCGGGAEYAAVRSAMVGHIRAGRVELTGRIAGSEVREILKRSHAFVLLSDFEGLPVSMLEAMDAGCVPIVYDMESGIPDVVRSGDNGLMVPHGDIAAVVDAVATLRADRKAWCRMAGAARRTIRDLKLTKDDMSDAYAAEIAQVFDEIESGAYRRPPSLAHGARIDGVLPPPALYDPTRGL